LAVGSGIRTSQLILKAVIDVYHDQKAYEQADQVLRQMQIPDCEYIS